MRYCSWCDGFLDPASDRRSQIWCHCAACPDWVKTLVKRLQPADMIIVSRLFRWGMIDVNEVLADPVLDRRIRRLVAMDIVRASKHLDHEYVTLSDHVLTQAGLRPNVPA